MKYDFEVILLPGIRLNDAGEPKPEMLRRANKAFEVWQRRHVPIVCCGADTAGVGISEAEVLRRILAEKGVPDSDIIKEDKSLITAQNFENAAAITGRGKKAAVVTSDYHMARSKILARKAGFRVRGFKAPTPGGKNKNRKRVLELFGILDALCGWQTGKPRPAGVERFKQNILRLFGETPLAK